MRMSELSRASGVPVATIKFYLREGLLAPGRPTAATQAQYDDEHVARLRLIRALVDVGRLPLTSVRAVLAIVDAGSEATPAAVGTAHDALPPHAERSTGEPRRAHDVLRRLGWHVDAHSSSVYQLEAALAALESVGLPPGPEQLRVYADAALAVARSDVAEVPAGSPSDAVHYVVIGTVLYEPVLLALRRLAQQHVFTGGESTPTTSARGRARRRPPT